jgi:putative membrane protein insertion efficiency factor
MNKILKKWPDLVIFFARGLHQFFSFGGCCRFEPTCSQYFAGVLEKKGLLEGACLGLKRVVRCHPWGGSGFDSIDER